MENKQTAVESLAILIYSDCQFGGTLDNRISIDKNYLEEIIDKAKAMEKEQISNGYYQGLIDGMNNSPREYYEETYGK